MKEVSGDGADSGTSPDEAPHFGLPPSAAAPVPDSLVLALSSATPPVGLLQRARALADGIGAALHVVRVLADMRTNPPAASHETFPELLRSVEQTLTAHRTTRAWMRTALSNGRGVERFAILHGDFVERVSVYARENSARLILLAASGEDGGLVTRLVAATNVPVLASRARSGNQTIVAATDLRHSDYPVLQFAALLGCQLEACVIALHNLRPGDALAPQTSADTHSSATDARVHAARLAHLRRAAEQLATATRSVVSHHPDPVEAILAQARAEEADLVVVGSRSRAWFEGSGRAGLAGRIVDRARRSVLVVPIGEVSEPSSDLAWG